MTEEELIQGCKMQEKQAQKQAYDHFSPRMFGICRRYLKSYEDAEDVLIEGFYKVFTKIDQYNGKGSFEGWIKRIMVNECLMFLRKKHSLYMTIEIKEKDEHIVSTVIDNLIAEDILKLLDLLPAGYRTVFNLYVMEGYKHREIAEMLGISINTSKSQLILAKKKLKKLLIQNKYPDVGS